METKVYGYVRVSSKDQNEDRQVHAMRQFGIPDERIFIEKQSGKDFNRPVYHSGRISFLSLITQMVINWFRGYRNSGKKANTSSDLIRNSVVETMLDVNEEDQILLLITCVGDDDERLIVAARRLREDEQINHLQMKKQSDGNH